MRTILKIFWDLAVEVEGGAPAIKQKPVFQTEHSNMVREGRSGRERIQRWGNREKASFCDY